MYILFGGGARPFESQLYGRNIAKLKAGGGLFRHFGQGERSWPMFTKNVWQKQAFYLGVEFDEFGRRTGVLHFF